VPQRGEEKRFEPQRAQRAQREECCEGFGCRKKTFHPSPLCALCVLCGKILLISIHLFTIHSIKRRVLNRRGRRGRRGKSVGRVLDYDCDYWFEKRREESWKMI